MIRIALLGMLACGALCAGAQTMYRWVDEKGRVHYSQDPPPEGKGEKVDVKPASPTDKPPRPDDWRARDLEFRKRQVERDRQFERDKAQAEKAAAQRKRLCTRARHQIEINADHIGAVYRRDEKGERVYLSPEERARAVERWKQVAKENC